MINQSDVVSDTSVFIGVIPPSRDGRRFTPQTSQTADGQAEAVHSRSGILAERPPREYRHWSPKSQVYAPGDVLLHLIDDGWQVYPKVFVETYRCVSRRQGMCTILYCCAAMSALACVSWITLLSDAWCRINSSMASFSGRRSRQMAQGHSGKKHRSKTGCSTPPFSPRSTYS